MHSRTRCILTLFCSVRVGNVIYKHFICSASRLRPVTCFLRPFFPGSNLRFIVTVRRRRFTSQVTDSSPHSCLHSEVKPEMKSDECIMYDVVVRMSRYKRLMCVQFIPRDQTSAHIPVLYLKMNSALTGPAWSAFSGQNSPIWSSVMHWWVSDRTESRGDADPELMENNEIIACKWRWTESRCMSRTGSSTRLHGPQADVRLELGYSRADLRPYMRLFAIDSGSGCAHTRGDVRNRWRVY